MTSAFPLLVFSPELELSLPEVMCRNSTKISREVEEEWAAQINFIRQQELHEDDQCIDIPEVLLEGERIRRDVAEISIRRLENHNEMKRKKMRKNILSQAVLDVSAGIKEQHPRQCAYHNNSQAHPDDLCDIVRGIVQMINGEANLLRYADREVVR